MRRAVVALLVLSAAWLTPVVDSGRAQPISARPGPPILYAPPATPPQLQNGRGWHAAPLMASGADAYVRGEYLYQDFVFDSYGANTTNAPLPPDVTPSTSDQSSSAPTGDVVYPTDAKTYGFNAADLLEFRTQLDGSGVTYRITLNTMLQPQAAGVAIGIDTDRSPRTGRADWGYGIGSLGRLGLEHVLVMWGKGARLDGRRVPASIDVRRNQIEVRAPSLRPNRRTWRHYVVVGLYDAKRAAFKQVLNQPTPSDPGGAHGTDTPPIFNVGFRFNEPLGREPEPGPRTVGNGNWREHAQAKALAARDISSFHSDIDFGKIATRARESRVPRHGWVSRLYASHLNLGEGARDARPMFLGPIQPYGVYVPTRYRAGRPAPMHLLLHSLGSNFNEYAAFMPNILRQLGEERGSFVLTTEGRGADGWYHDEAEVDLFEAWADLARVYDIDADRVTIGGYSMGGYGTYKIASQYPDLFARGFAIVGPPDEHPLGGPTGGLVEDEQNTVRIAENLRNVPLLMWNGLNDELVPAAGVLLLEQRLYDLAYRHELDLFPGFDHLAFAIVDQWGPGQDFLGRATVEHAPARVTYRAMPEMDNAKLGLAHDHAYWVSDIRVARGARSGLVDTTSLALAGETVDARDASGVGTEPAPHVRRAIEWLLARLPQRASVPNKIELHVTDVSAVTVWVEQAGLDTTRPIVITTESNRPVTVMLRADDGFRRLTLPVGRSRHVVSL
jgi:dienelactone hydrolase